MKILHLAGIYTGSGFRAKDGRRPQESDLGFIEGPAWIEFDDKTKMITAVEKGTPHLAPGEAAIDASGLVATAGFVDSHTHLIYAGDRAKEFFMRWRGAQYAEIAAAGGGIHNTNQDTTEASESELLELLRARAEDAWSSGTTTLEIKSGYGGTPEGELRTLRTIRTFANSQPARCPQIRSTFLALHALPKGTPEKDYVDGMIGALPKVAAEKLADFVDAFPEQGFFSVKESLRFVEAAKMHGLPAKIHADEITDTGSAAAFARAGAISVDHLQQVNAEGLRALAETSTVACLLPATSFYLGLPYAPARKLLDAGAKVALSTDANPGTSPSQELRLTALLAASQYKMSPAEILCALTWNGAAALGLKDRGVIEKSHRADILLWECPKRGRSSGKLESILIGTSTLRKVV